MPWAMVQGDDMAYHLWPTREVEIYLRWAPAMLQDIVFELRSVIVAVAPGATEVLHRNGLSYFDRDRGGPVSAGICQIRVRVDQVHLVFIHGAFLPDPERLLEGRQKAMRHVVLASYADAPWPALQALIAEAARFDPRAWE